MPKFGSHIIFADNAQQKRPELFGQVHREALRFGAVGPDTTLFLFDPATSDPSLRRGIKTVLDVLQTVQDIKEKVEDVTETLTEPVGDLADWFSGGLSKDLSYMVNGGIEALILATKLGLTVGAGTINVKNPIFSELGDLPADFIKDPANAAEKWTIGASDNFGFPFRMFGHPLTDDGKWHEPELPKDYSNWWWMDMLHYRKTGQFAKQLLSNAKGPVQTSYANGYMTHVAGDICGHPFINALVGGPFRNHAYRHLVLESLADTWLWNQQGRGDILDARFDDQINLEDSDAIQISDLVISTMKEVYQEPMVPNHLAHKYPQQEEFLSAYRLMQQYLRLSTNGSIKRPTPPPEGIKEILNELNHLLKKNTPGPPPKWNGDIIQFLTALFSWAGKGFTLLIMIATLPLAAFQRILAIPGRWMIYLINLGLFYVISSIRMMLCLTGWGYAGKEDFDSFGFLDDMITTPNFEMNRYPYKTAKVKPPFYWLFKPEWLDNTVEEPATIPMIPASPGIKPSWMIDPANDISVATEQAILDVFNAKTPLETRKLEFQLAGSNGFGNAVDFSILLLDGTLPVPDLDLDGDRGFGYKGWEKLPPDEYYI